MGEFKRWVIERPQVVDPRDTSGQFFIGLKGMWVDFGTDAQQAILFPSKESAEGFIAQASGMALCKAVEHVWVDTPDAPAAAHVGLDIKRGAFNDSDWTDRNAIHRWCVAHKWVSVERWDEHKAHTAELLDSRQK